MQEEAPKSVFMMTVIGLVALILILTAVYYLMRAKVNNSQTVTTATSTVTTTVVNGTCAFRVTSHEPNDKVSFPVTVNGRIDNTKAKDGCRWILFEGEAGSAQVFANKNNVTWEPIGLATPVPVANWMSTTTNFSVTLDYNQSINIPSGTKLKIRFTENNPAGDSQVRFYDLPVVLK